MSGGTGGASVTFWSRHQARRIDELPARSLADLVTDHIARFTTSTGDVGYGMVEYIFAGPKEKYGFSGFDDGAA